MHGAYGDIDGFIFVHGPDLVTDRHLGSPAHNDPVLSTVPMFLQRENAARDNDDALDLKALAEVD